MRREEQETGAGNQVAMPRSWLAAAEGSEWPGLPRWFSGAAGLSPFLSEEGPGLTVDHRDASVQLGAGLELLPWILGLGS